jgi:hypothetical protein
MSRSFGSDRPRRTAAGWRTWAGLALFFLAGSRAAEAQYYKTTVASFTTTNVAFTSVTGGMLQFTPASSSDIWIFLISAKLQTTATAAAPSVEAQYLINGTVRGQGGIYIDNAGGPNGSWLHFDRVTGTTAQQTVEVQLRAASGTSTIFDLQMIAFKLPANADFQFAETTGSQSVTAGSYNNYQSLTFTPSSAGTYLGFAVATAQMTPGSTAVGIRLRDGVGTTWPVDSGVAPNFMANPTNALQSFFAVRSAAVPASSQTFNIQANGGTGGSTIRNTRLMAFRTDVFDSYQNAEDTAEVSVTNTVPMRTSIVTTTKPPSARDYIVLQSFVQRAAASGARFRQSEFRRDGVARTNFGHLVNNASYWASYGYFDAQTTSKSVVYENYGYVSNTGGGFTSNVKESVIEVLGLPKAAAPLQVSAGTGVPTPTVCAPNGRSGYYYRVTAPSSFEMVFDSSVGGGIGCFWDLAEDPLEEYDLAGGRLSSAGVKTLSKISLFDGTNYYDPDDNHNDPASPGWNGAPPRLDLLEATPSRVRLREEAFYQEAVAMSGAVFPGVKAFFDYSVYPTGRLAVRQNRKSTATTPSVSNSGVESSSTTGVAPDPRANNFTACGQSPTACGFATGTTPGTDDFLLAVREQVSWITAGTKSGGVRTDLLDILYQDWAAVNQLEVDNTVAFMTWRDTTPGTIPGAGGGASDVWNHLYYFKPTNFLGNNDTAVTGRVSDFRSPGTLVFGAKGSTWRDAAENTAADDFNESEGAYVLTADTTPGAEGAIFGLDGSTTTRFSPFFKIRQWRSVNPPQTVSLGSTLTRNVDYRSDVKPVSRAPFASSLLWHSTLESAAAVTTPDVGSAGTVNGAAAAAAGRYGQGYSFNAATKSITFPSAGNFDLAKGVVAFWYQPTYDSATDATNRVLWYNEGDATHYFLLQKDATKKLVFSIRNGASTTSVTVSAPNYSWRSSEWTHFQVFWDASAGAGLQARLFFDGMEVPHTDAGTYSTAGMAVGLNYIGNDSTGNAFAQGIIDEFLVYGNAGGATALAQGGLASSASEYLAVGSASHDFTLDFTAVDASKRGTYFYVGGDSKFLGLNVVLATAGTGVAANALPWEYWNGTAWTALTTTDQTNSLTTARGAISWADPGNWAAYSADGGPDLYYVRSHLVNGAAYATKPVEALITTDILLLQYYGDITDIAANSTFSVGPPIQTTAVTLGSFEAQGTNEGVELQWSTATELDNLGFHLYRATTPGGPYERITSAVIPGLAGSVAGQSYSYHDVGLTAGVVYYYKLEDIDTSGHTDSHGPVSARAGVPASSSRDGGSGSSSGSSGDGSDGSGGAGTGTPPAPAAKVAYGSTEPASLRVLSRTDREAWLELTTPGFYATANGAGSVVLEVPGFEIASAAGAPGVPTKRAWLEAVAGRTVRIASVAESDVISFPGLRPVATPAADIAVGASGTVRPASRPRPESTAFRGAYPRVSARLQGVGFQGDRKKAELQLAPLRWDGSGERLLLARRLRVRVVFTGIDTAEVALGGSRGRRPRRPETPLQTGAVASLVTSAAGLHAVRFEDVFAPGRAPVPAAALRLAHLGVPAAFHLEPDAPLFGPGSRLFFVSDGAAANADENVAVYELAVGAGGLKMPVVPTLPSGAAVRYAWSDARFEQNRFYQSALLDAPDLWLWDLIVAPNTKTYHFPLAGLASSPDPGHLRVVLQGASDFDANPDHHVRASVNGVPVGEVSWDGKTAIVLEGDLADGVLQEGDNRLDLQNVGDTAASSSMVFLDRFEVRYPRQLAAAAGVLDADFSASGVATVAGLAAGTAVVDTTTTPRWLRQTAAKPAGLAFRVEAGHRYMAVGPSSVLRPDVRLPVPSTLRSRQSSADYLLIAPQEFLPAAKPLLELRESQGLRTRAVSLEEVVQEFGHGETHPAAIRDFLTFAYQSWQRPSLRYVLLLGDATYDPKDFLHTGIKSRIPALTVKTSYLWTASDPSLAKVNGDDELPDLAIGRLPASSLAEAQVLVQKLLGYESGPHDLQGTALLVADNADIAGNFEDDADDVAATVLSGRPIEKIYLRDHLNDPNDPNPVLSTRTAIGSALDASPAIVNYIGHGGIAVWASENFWNNLDVNNLAPQGPATVPPLLFTMNCLNGYFHFPSLNSLTEQFIKAPGKGAVAAVSPSGLSVNDPAHVYHKALLGEILSGRHERLGDAVLAAQSAYADSGAFPELLGIYHVFGDPAMRIR